MTDPLCQEVARYCREGWGEKGRIKCPIKRYYPGSSEISIVHEDGLLMRYERLIIPSALQKKVLEQIHTSHHGIGKCSERARHTVWWPGLSSEMEDVVGKCRSCCINEAQKGIERMIPSAFPDSPRQKVGVWKRNKKSIHEISRLPKFSTCSY